MHIIRLAIIVGLITLTHSFAAPQPVNADAYIKTNCKKLKTDELCGAKGGIEFIYIYGEIDLNTARTIASTSGIIPLNKPFPKVYLNSRGGSSRYAKEIGRILRLRNAEVDSKDVFSPEKEPLCASACVEIAAGATKRNLFGIKVHRGSWVSRLKGDNYKYEIMSDSDMQQTYDYFKEMGMSDELIELVKYSDAGEFISIPYHPDLSFKHQKLVQLGFRMKEPSDDELDKMKRSTEDYDVNATEAYLKQAKGGDKDAAYILGKRYLLGIEDEKQDINKGLQWLIKAADMRNPLACHLLGITYRDGLGSITKDLRRSFDYFLRGAKLGFSGSQNNVGWAYYKGNGTEMNLYDAVYWITKAAEQGEPFGYGSLAELRFREKIFASDDIETLKFYILAINSLPKGNSLNDDIRDMNALKKRMTSTQIATAERLAKEWQPIKDNGSTMRDKDDK